MAMLKTQKTKASVAEFLKSLPDAEQRKDATRIKQMLQDASSEKPAMWGASIVGYGECRLRYDSGRELDWFLVGFSPRKDSLSLYLNITALPGADALLAKLGKHKTGKGCLYIKRLSDVDLPTLEKLMESSVAW